MLEIGKVIYQITQQMSEHPSEAVQTLCRVFREQYIEDEHGVMPRSKEEIRADSVQSPHDTDCHYRSKGDDQIKGYSINVTETCSSDNPLNLITDVHIDVASTADCDFLQPAIKSTCEVVNTNPETVNADGAYHSVENQQYCKEKDIDLILGAIQGRPPRYDLSYDEMQNLTVTDLSTNTTVPCRQIRSRKDNTYKWVVKDDKGNSRYFTQKEIDTCLLRKQIASREQKLLNVRNNVEATIFQLGYHYSNAKSRYRGLIKHKIWANARCLWVNFARILKFIVLNGENCLQNTKKRLILSQLLSDFGKIMLAKFFVRNFCLTFTKCEK
jgi:hypothetical protein